MNSDGDIGKNGFKCGVFDIEPSRNLFIHNGKTYSLEPRIMDVLCVLAERPGEVLTRDDLIDRIWKVEFGADESLTRAISLLRKTFKKAGATDVYIETFPKRGYRLAQPVVQFSNQPAKPTIEKRERPVIEPTESNQAPENLKNNAEPSESDPLPVHQDRTPVIAQETLKTPKRKFTSILLPVVLVLGAFVAVFFLTDKPDMEKTAQNRDRSIAVLPFEDYSPAKDQAYFADGIAEELLNVLARIDGLRVASRTSSFSYRSETKNAGNIGSDLDVGHILEGSVRKIGGTVRISAQLIDTQSDEHIWSNTYDRELTTENIFAVQDDISRAIASELKVRMDISQTSDGPPTSSTDAYEAYLRGKALYAPRTKEAIEASIKELKRAVSLDPGFADAHATLARVYMMASEYGAMEYNKAYSQASIHLETAIDLAPNSSESLTAKAQVLFQQRQFLIAFEYFNVATVSNPYDPEAWRGKGLSLRELGQLDEAKSALEHAQQISPMSSIIHLNLSNIEMYREDIEAAIENVENAMLLDSNNIAAREQLSLLTLSKGDYAGAHKLFLENISKFPRITNHLQRLYYLIGRPDLETTSMDWYNKAYLAFNAGDGEKATKLALDPNNPGPFAQTVEVLYNAGKLDEAYAVVKQDKVQMEIFSKPTPIGAFNENIAILYYKVLSAKADPASVILYDKLATRFDKKKPSDFRLPSSVQTGASWQLVNNNHDELLEWLDAMNERGQLWRQFEFDPLYDTLADTTAFEARWEVMEETASIYSAEIDKQLSAP